MLNAFRHHYLHFGNHMKCNFKLKTLVKIGKWSLFVYVFFGGGGGGLLKEELYVILVFLW